MEAEEIARFEEIARGSQSLFVEDGNGAQYVEADEELFKELVSGVVAHQDSIDEAISVSIAQGWTLQRVERILRAILRAGTFELTHKSEVPKKVVINEYLDIAHAFFSENEPSFVNGVLDAVSTQTLRNAADL